MKSRGATHAGSWYDGNPRRLSCQLSNWLEEAEFSNTAKALIVPHAGYSYRLGFDNVSEKYTSGSTAAWAYKQIVPAKINRIFIFGPSHRVYLTECALPEVDVYETPLGNLKLDKEIISNLKATDQFRTMNTRVDEEEHSIEMQLPYLAYVFKERLDDVTFIPVLVGSLNPAKEAAYGKMFCNYMKKEDTLFVISSDFCHWGDRFDYFHRNPVFAEIYDSIESLDKEGITFIENKDGNGFHSYLKQKKNTICGRHPISLFLETLANAEKDSELNTEIKLLKYEQSNQVRKSSDSSVSYAAILCNA